MGAINEAWEYKIVSLLETHCQGSAPFCLAVEPATGESVLERFDGKLCQEASRSYPFRMRLGVNAVTAASGGLAC